MADIGEEIGLQLIGFLGFRKGIFKNKGLLLLFLHCRGNIRTGQKDLAPALVKIKETQGFDLTLRRAFFDGERKGVFLRLIKFVSNMMYNDINKRQGSFIYEGISIALDPSRSLSGNAQLYYKRAKKAKETIRLSLQNQTATEKALLDVQSALKQLTASDESGLEVLAKELEISPQKAAQKKKNGDWKGLSHDSIPWQIDFHGRR